MSTQPPSKSGPRRAFRVGKYEIVSSATIKALGQIHRAHDDEADRDVLLLVLTDIATNKARQEALSRLYKLASGIEHDHLLTAVDCGNVHDTWYMALEWVEPVDLHDYIDKKQTVPMSEVVQIVRQLTEALQRLHDAGQSHGNVRPGTILIGNEGGVPAVKLLHPALVRPARADEWRSTVGGLKVGALDYQAPETLENREALDIRSDLYSLGCVLYHLMAGRPPYADALPGARAALHREGRYPNIANFNSSVSPELAALLPKLLAVDPSERLASPAKLLHLLNSIKAPSQKQQEGFDASHEAVEGLFSNHDLLAGLAQGTKAEAAASGGRARDDDDDGDSYGVAGEAAKADSPAEKAPVPRRLEVDREGYDLVDTPEAKPDNIAAPVRRPNPRVPTTGRDRDEASGEFRAERPVDGPKSERSAGPERRTTRNFPDSAVREGTGLGSTNRGSASEKPDPKSGETMPEKLSGMPPEGRTDGGDGRDDGDDTGQSEPEKDYKKLIYVSAGVLLFVLVGFVTTKLISSALKGNDEESSSSKVVKRHVTPPGGSNVTGGSSSEESHSSEPVKSGFKKLYIPKEPVNREELTKQIEGPWLSATAPDWDKAPVYRVSRLPVEVEGEAKPAKTFDSIAAACEAAPEGSAVVIELADNGPIYLSPFAIKNRTLCVRPAKTMRPLIVWDVADKDAARAQALVTVEKGTFRLENVEVVAKCPNPAESGSAFVRVIDGDAWLHVCTFSVSGKPTKQDQSGVAIVKFEGQTKGKTCRLEHCFGRGMNLVAVDASAPSAEILLQNCLMAGDLAPLFRLAGNKDSGPTLRLFRTTLVCGNVGLELRGQGGDTKSPGASFLACDTLISRAAHKAGGVMVHLPKDAEDADIKWKAVTCLYGGWDKLIDGPAPLAARDIEGWHKRWDMSEGDISVPDLQRTVAEPDDLAVVSAGFYAPHEKDNPTFAYEATYPLFDLGAPIGYSVLLLYMEMYPGLPRASWPGETYDHVPLPRVTLQTPPPIDDAKDSKYHGERLNLNELRDKKSDLGSHLTTMAPRMANKVVMHLVGSGPVECKPFFLKGVELVLYVEPPKDKGTPPLILVPVAGQVDAAQQGFIEVSFGRLELINVTIDLTRSKATKLTHYLVCVEPGELCLESCKLHHPWSHGFDDFRAMVGLAGCGVPEPGKNENVSFCQVQDSVIDGGSVCIHMSSIGSRLRVENSALTTTSHGIYFTPSGDSGSLNLFCLVDHTTIAAGGAAVVVAEPQNLLLAPTFSPYPVVPQPIVVQSHANVFLNPFHENDGKPTSAGLIAYEGSALTRGTLVWQGDGDVYDKRLRYFAAPLKAGSGAGQDQQDPDTMTRLWGHAGHRQPNHDVTFTATVDPKANPTHLHFLLLPDDANLKDPKPGANLAALGIKKP